MEIALVQSDIVWGDPAANRKRLDSLLSSAPRADLYVLPEMFSTGFNGVCESDPSETLGYLRDKARSCGCAFAGSLAISFPDRLSANRFFLSLPRNNSSTTRGIFLLMPGSRSALFPEPRGRFWSGAGCVSFP